MPPSDLTIRAVPSLAGVDAASWDACANPQANAPRGDAAPDAQVERFNPFVTHAFLTCCEASGSATRRTGWGGAHVLVEDADKKLLACAPAYAKTHSQGEYVFDHGWADAYERAGGSYYPKLQVCVPFTPAPGRRLLVAAGPREKEARETLVAGLKAATEKIGASSLHVTFGTKAEYEDLSLIHI